MKKFIIFFTIFFSVLLISCNNNEPSNDNNTNQPIQLNEQITNISNSERLYFNTNFKVKYDETLEEEKVLINIEGYYRAENKYLHLIEKTQEYELNGISEKNSNLVYMLNDKGKVSTYTENNLIYKPIGSDKYENLVYYNDSSVTTLIYLEHLFNTKSGIQLLPIINKNMTLSSGTETIKLKELLKLELYSSLNSILKKYKVNILPFNENDIILEYSVTNKEIVIKYELLFNNDKTLKVSCETIISKKLNNYKFIDEDENAVILCKTFESLFKTYKANQSITCFGNSIFRFELEPGLYAIAANKDMFKTYEIRFLDKDKNVIENNMYKNNDQYNFIEESLFSKTINIKEAGTYYLEIIFDNFYSSSKKAYPYEFSLIPIDYDNIFDMNNTKELKSNSFKLEGKYDAEVFKYNSLENGIIKINTISDTTVWLSCLRSTWKGQEVITSTANNIYLEVFEGDNYFIFSSNDYEDLEFNIDLEVEIVNDYITPKDEIYELKEEATKQKFNIGTASGGNSIKFKLEVNEKAKYKINPMYNENESFSYLILNENNEELYYGNNFDMYELEKGTYYITISFPSIGVCLENFYYEIIE